MTFIHVTVFSTSYKPLSDSCLVEEPVVRFITHVVSSASLVLHVR